MILLWLAVIVVGLVGAQSRLFRKNALKKLEYERHFKQRTCFPGEEVEMIERLSNLKWLPVPWLRIESLLPMELRFRHQDNFLVSSGNMYQNHHSFFSLSPYTRITRTHWIKPAKRGWYRLNTVTLTSGDLFGNSRHSNQLPLGGELIVYPKPADVAIERLPHNNWQGDSIVRRFIVPDPFVVAGARPYSAGDSFRHVNWKATARTGHLQVHKYDYTADRCLMIYLNVEDGEGMWRSISNEALIERGFEWAAGAAFAAIGAGMAAGFAANMPLSGEREDRTIEPRTGKEHLLALLEWMAKLSLERTVPFAELLARAAASGYSRRDAIVISAYWNEALEHEANRLRGNGNSVTVWVISEPDNESEHSDQSGRGITA